MLQQYRSLSHHPARPPKGQSLEQASPKERAGLAKPSCEEELRSVTKQGRAQERSADRTVALLVARDQLRLLSGGEPP